MVTNLYRKENQLTGGRREDERITELIVGTGFAVDLGPSLSLLPFQGRSVTLPGTKIVSLELGISHERTLLSSSVMFSSLQPHRL